MGGGWGGFFFQAEDGIRDRLVTGVQTCALPIFMPGYGERGHTYRALRFHEQRALRITPD